MMTRTARGLGWATLLVGAAWSSSCAEPGDSAAVEEETAGLRIDIQDQVIDGTFTRDGMVVAFSAQLSAQGVGASVESTLADAGALTDAVCRLPNGADAGDAASDWARRPPTPGSANQ